MPMRPFVEGLQRPLIPRGDRLDEARPVLLGHGRMGFVGVEDAAEIIRRRVIRILELLSIVTHCLG